jgi:hypothetical protein
MSRVFCSQWARRSETRPGPGAGAALSRPRAPLTMACVAACGLWLAAGCGTNPEYAGPAPAVEFDYLNMQTRLPQTSTV